MKIKPLLWALSPFAAGALLWLTLGAAADLENVYFPSVRVAHTNYVNELISSNGITLGGVRNTAWPAGGGGFVGAVSNNVASAGLLSVDSTKTNGIAATYAHITNALGFIPATNGVGGGGTVGTVINTTTGTAGMPLVLSGTNPTNSVPTNLLSLVNLEMPPVSPTHAGTTTLNFSTNGQVWLTATGQVTVASSSLAAGRGVTLWVDNPQATNINVILPSTWRYISGTTTNILASSKVGVLRAFSRAAADTNVVSLWSSE